MISTEIINHVIGKDRKIGIGNFLQVDHLLPNKTESPRFDPIGPEKASGLLVVPSKVIIKTCLNGSSFKWSKHIAH